MEDTSEIYPAWLSSGLWHKEMGWRRLSVENLSTWWEKRMWPGWCLRTLLAWLLPSIGNVNTSKDCGGHQCELCHWLQGRLTFHGSSTYQGLRDRGRFKCVTVAPNHFVFCSTRETGDSSLGWCRVCVGRAPLGLGPPSPHTNVADGADRLTCPCAFPAVGQQDL